MQDALWSLAAYALQIAALAAAAVVAAWLMRVREPRHALRLWQAVMAIALLLPLAQPRAVDPPALQFIAQSIALAAPGPAADTATGIGTVTAIVLIIAAGAIARLMWLGIGLLSLRAIIARAVPADALDDMTTDLSQALGVAASVRITDDLEGPATVGFRRPLVLVPRQVLDMAAPVQRAILCHELLHVKRGDWLQTIAEEVWRSALWFHPLARLIAARLSLSREMVVDELTIRHTRDRRAYAEALLAFSNPQPHVIGVTPFIGRRTLSQRISLIAQEDPMSRSRARAGHVLALAACIGITAATVDRVPMFATLNAQSTVYRPGNGVSLPVVVKEVKPAYTGAAMQAGIQGSVWLECVVTETGDVSNIVVTKSLDTEYGLDQEAVKAAGQWKFKPARKDGKAVAARITLELTFTLKK